MRLRRIAPPLSLCFATLLVWCAATGHWTFDSWRTPLQLHGDPLEIYARVQIASEDLSAPLRGFTDLPRLGAPGTADWRHYPVSDRVVFTFLGALARLVGLFPAMNLAMAGVHLLNALSFYLCARFLRWRWEWAFATALLFSFANYNFRWGVTISFSLTFVIPPLLLLCGWIARGAPAIRARPWILAAGALGAWFGTANPYLGFFAAQLVGLCIVLQFLRRREPARWRAGILFLTTLLGVFLLHYSPYLFAPDEDGLTLDRNYAASEVYALKPADLVIPPSEHRLQALADIGKSYFAQSSVRGEFFINYPGVFGLLGLGLLFWTALRAVARPRISRVPDAALGCIWTFLFSSVGGINSLLALAGLDLFRAANRNSIFLLVWALWFFGRWCNRQSLPIPPFARFALPLAIAALGLLDHLPRLPSQALLRAHRDTVDTSRSVLSRLEQQLGPHAQIFQIPNPPFLEAGPIGQMQDYEHFLPFITSSTLRFSYGALRDTAAAHYLEALASAPAPLLKQTLESSGFHAIWLDRRAFSDRGEQRLAELRSAGMPEIPQSELPHIALFQLQPSPTPVPPNLFDPAILPPWDPQSPPDTLKLAILRGWHGIERDNTSVWRWAQDAADVGLILPDAASVEFSFIAFSGSPGELTLEIDGVEAWRAPVHWLSRTPQTVTVPFSAGTHLLVWKFDGPVRRASAGDPRQIGFAIGDLKAVSLPAR